MEGKCPKTFLHNIFSWSCSNIPKLLLDFWLHLSIQHQIANSSLHFSPLLCHNFRPEWRIFDLLFEEFWPRFCQKWKTCFRIADKIMFNQDFCHILGPMRCFSVVLKTKRDRESWDRFFGKPYRPPLCQCFQKSFHFYCWVFLPYLWGRERNAPCSGETVGKPPENWPLFEFQWLLDPNVYKTPTTRTFSKVLRQFSSAQRPASTFLIVLFTLFCY